METESNKLRLVYFDAKENATLTLSGEEFPAELFTFCFTADGLSGGSKPEIAISGMSIKRSSDSDGAESMIIVNTEQAKNSMEVVLGISYRAMCLYTGDDVDLISSTQKAVAVAVTGISKGAKLSYNDGILHYDFKYSTEISAKTGVATYLALVDAELPMENFVNAEYMKVVGGQAEALILGDTNGDGVINAQDALNIVDAWTRRGDAPDGDAPDGDAILSMNVNGDSRINTFDALGIVEAFVNNSEYVLITKAATITAN